MAANAMMLNASVRFPPTGLYLLMRSDAGRLLQSVVDGLGVVDHDVQNARNTGGPMLAKGRGVEQTLYATRRRLENLLSKFTDGQSLFNQAKFELELRLEWREAPQPLAQRLPKHASPGPVAATGQAAMDANMENAFFNAMMRLSRETAGSDRCSAATSRGVQRPASAVELALVQQELAAAREEIALLKAQRKGLGGETQNTRAGHRSSEGS
eukprot:GHVN01097667.1.p1 GENE.GHVN01097667.1~~GHVN01097667.1.p1  ORF type:complete len:212 (-),score=19.45 GHVN01097667.1:31-666(-)